MFIVPQYNSGMNDLLLKRVPHFLECKIGLPSEDQHVKSFLKTSFHLWVFFVSYFCISAELLMQPYALSMYFLRIRISEKGM